MDYRELRYGNIVTDKDGSITTISGDCIFFEGANYEPVKLTEEWLLKFGFEKKGESSMYLNDFGLNPFKGIYRAVYYRGNIWGQEIRFVHQLQNLYFALTGTELTIIS